MHFTAEEWAYIAYLVQDKNVSIKDISSKTGVSVATIYRLKQTKIGRPKHSTRTPVKHPGGRPKKLTMRDKRHLLRCIPVLTEEKGNFCTKRLMQRAWLSKKKVSDRTVRRCLNENGYYYLRTHTKSLMSKTIRENAGYSQNKYRTTIQRMYGFRKLLFTSMVYSGPQGSLRFISQHILNN